LGKIGRRQRAVGLAARQQTADGRFYCGDVDAQRSLANLACGLMFPAASDGPQASSPQSRRRSAPKSLFHRKLTVLWQS
jgi:hypothetical protein